MFVFFRSMFCTCWELIPHEDCSSQRLAYVTMKGADPSMNESCDRASLYGSLSSP